MRMDTGLFARFSFWNASRLLIYRDDISAALVQNKRTDDRLMWTVFIVRGHMQSVLILA